MSNPIKLYNFPKSGHAHRIELMLSLLNLPTELVFVDLAKGAHKQPDFLALNPFGQVPVIDDNGTVIADSNAILVYLAKKYDNGTWLPEEPAAAARVQRWLSVAAGPLAFGPAAARLVTVFGAAFNTDEVIARAHTLLKVIDAELAKAPFLAGSTPTIADIANYSYIAHAPEGNVSLEPYANVRSWLARIESLPGFVAMPRTVIGLQTSA
ncbi:MULTISPECIES: glutathione S-transferase family protein [Pseudomonas]|jgi:glutathione S-transferase|uniref:Glutathione S-transferase family protein n=1 Tax=Pseudomonas putida NBRC 14164 TaxID=1211579 RepID=A0ABM7EAS7_PSEPU|nr:MULTISPECIES: glutathione S-transferase [Pseudomonas]EKT4463968.1 glutathione S-transferase [Pseudomonas putida]EKT4556704.1 glutathione S-transferase [Pseudomonas putida]ELF6207765.1 glutathione S-transferase [Pseudomonas putida]MCC9009500.1 glutathione S-transferase [Pseudomonas putida]MCI1040376.1 glutathione S-transferase [Pseudomonas putida]